MKCNCNDVRELLPELAAGTAGAAPEITAHLEECTACTDRLDEFRKTIALLDEWQAPEPSPYFDTRLQARLREEMAQEAARGSGWLAWLRRPALAVSLTLALVVGATIFETNDRGQRPPSSPVAVVGDPGTAVGDLQALDKNHDLYSDFDVLDDLQVQQNVTANP